MWIQICSLYSSKISTTLNRFFLITTLFLLQLMTRMATSAAAIIISAIIAAATRTCSCDSANYGSANNPEEYLRSGTKASMCCIGSAGGTGIGSSFSVRSVSGISSHDGRCADKQHRYH